MTVHEKAVGGSVEWFTPPGLFDAIRLDFDLDPASPESGPVSWVPARRFITPSADGLRQPWSGRAGIRRLIAHYPASAEAPQ